MIVEVPQFFNICYYPIRGVCNGSKKTTYGFIWRYVNSDGTIKE